MFLADVGVFVIRLTFTFCLSPLFPRYLALYAYKPQKADELELRKGEMYRVTEKCQDGWFKGTSLRTAASGVFPGNYVTPVSRYASSASGIERLEDFLVTLCHRHIQIKARSSHINGVALAVNLKVQFVTSFTKIGK